MVIFNRKKLTYPLIKVTIIETPLFRPSPVKAIILGPDPKDGLIRGFLLYRMFILTADMTKLRMAVPPPSSADSMEVTMVRMRVMLPLTTAHTDSST